MLAVVLAAGDGGRLRARTQGAPKALLALHGRPIIHHVLDALFAAGVRDAIVVIGYEGAQVRRALEQPHPCGMTLRFAENPAYDRENARSLYAARDAVGDARGFLLAMADHVVEPALIADVVDGAHEFGACRLAVDFVAADGPRAAGATRALVRGGRVLELGKDLREWNAIDTGVFWCTPRVFEAMTPDLRDGEASAIFATLAAAGGLGAVDVSGRRWVDIDTEDDLRAAEEMLGAHGRFA